MWMMMIMMMMMAANLGSGRGEAKRQGQMRQRQRPSGWQQQGVAGCVHSARLLISYYAEWHAWWMRSGSE